MGSAEGNIETMLKVTRDTLELVFARTRVDPITGCRIWLGGKRPNGYGVICIHSKRWVVHRHVWTLFYGNIPEGLCVLHRCDNRLCCEPDHLFLGTRADNVRDKTVKGRNNGPAGERNIWHKITTVQVVEIRQLLKEGRLTQKEIGALYDLSQQGVSHISRRDTWRHLP